MLNNVSVCIVRFSTVEELNVVVVVEVDSCLRALSNIDEHDVVVVGVGSVA
jgi:hypothetical protein